MGACNISREQSSEFQLTLFPKAIKEHVTLNVLFQIYPFHALQFCVRVGGEALQSNEQSQSQWFEQIAKRDQKEGNPLENAFLICPLGSLIANPSLLCLGDLQCEKSCMRERISVRACGHYPSGRHCRPLNWIDWVEGGSDYKVHTCTLLHLKILPSLTAVTFQLIQLYSWVCLLVCVLGCKFQEV